MKTYSVTLSRKAFLQQLTVAVASFSFTHAEIAIATTDRKSTRYPIGICDWSLRKIENTDALRLAKELGINGVQVSVGSKADELSIIQRSIQNKFKQAARHHEVAISSLRAAALSKFPLKSAPESEKLISDAIDVARALGCQVILLPFFGMGTLMNDPSGVATAIQRLKRVTRKAERHNICLGIESWLSAEAHLSMIKAVESTHLKVYYDVANAAHMGYNVLDEIRFLGNESICEIHFKTNGVLLENGNMDFPAVIAALDEISYTGWVIIEDSIPKGMDIMDACKKNAGYIRSLLS